MTCLDHIPIVFKPPLLLDNPSSFFIMNTPTINLINSSANTGIGLRPTHPLHVQSFGYQLWELDTVNTDSPHPHCYLLLRKWDCNCAVDKHKRKTLHLFQVDSPLAFEHPDSRIYVILYVLGSADHWEESPHARRYRGQYGRGEMFGSYRRGSILLSDIVDLTNRFQNGEIFLDENTYTLCDCNKYTSLHAPHLSSC